MKKTVLVLLCCAMIGSTVSCNQGDNMDSGTEHTSQSTEMQDGIHNNVDILGNTENSDGDTDEIITNDTKESIQTIQYRLFQETVEANVYDKWLEKERSQATRTDKEIYADYWKFWKNELLFTIEKAKPLFDDMDEYHEWKSNLEQWLVTTQEILKNEMSVCKVTMSQLEVIIPYCKLIRQKAIDTKYFCYSIENYCLDDVDAANSIGLCWLNDLSK